MPKATFFAVWFGCAALAGSAAADVKTEEVEYRQGDTVLQGFVAYDDAAKGRRPGVLVIHEWWGHNEHAREQARKLAKAGYVGFAVDMYGKGKVTKHPSEAKGFMEEVTKDPQLVAARFDAGLAALKRRPQVDAERIAVFGYCFGGTVALQMARQGADVDAVAVFHAGLAPAGPPAAKGKTRARILAQEGGADPFVPRAQVAAFEKEMKAAGVKAKVITYPNVKHGFTNPDADKAGMDALGYDAGADQKSWRAATAFLRQVFEK